MRPLIERVVRELASYERPSASDGERRAAEWLAGELRAAGCREVRVEQEQAHGGYWWPLGLLNVAALVAATLGRRAAALVGGLAAAAVYDDVSGGRLWFRRRTLPHRPTYNVVAEAGDPQGARTLVFVAHHDAANGGLIFRPELTRLVADTFPGWYDRQSTSAQMLRLVAAGPALAGLGGLVGSRVLRRLGAFIAAGSTLAFFDIGTRTVVPGANDNLTAVAVILELADDVAEQHQPLDPVERVEQRPERRRMTQHIALEPGAEMKVRHHERAHPATIAHSAHPAREVPSTPWPSRTRTSPSCSTRGSRSSATGAARRWRGCAT
jgi:hypothetical protein